MSRAEVVEGAIWRHRERGTLYIIESVRNLQVSNEEHRDLDGAAIVDYRGEDGKGWSRPLDEFVDGRFEYVGSFPWLFDDTRRIRGRIRGPFGL